MEIDGPTVEEWAARVGAAQGYADIEHTVELFGTCAECQRAGANGSGGRPAQVTSE